MKNEDLKELIGIITEKDISEFAMEREDAAVRIKRGFAPMYAGTEIEGISPSSSVQNQLLPAPPALLPGNQGRVPAVVDGPPAKVDLHVLRSHTVGIFHDSRVPGSPPYIETGKKVKEGQVTGLIEILRLMVEVESDIEGEIVEKLVNEGDPVEYGQALFAIRPYKEGPSATGS